MPPRVEAMGSRPDAEIGPIAAQEMQLRAEQAIVVAAEAYEERDYPRSVAQLNIACEVYARLAGSLPQYGPHLRACRRARSQVKILLAEQLQREAAEAMAQDLGAEATRKYEQALRLLHEASRGE